MEKYIIVILVLVILWVITKIPQIGKIFIIKISPGKVIVKKGKPPERFIKECKLIIRHQIVRGYICGIKNEDGISLNFSSSIEPGQAQTFRNVFPFELFSRKRISSNTDGNGPKKSFGKG